MKFFTYNQDVEIQNPKLRGRILGVSAYADSEVFYRVATNLGPLIVHETLLRAWVDYDGNEPSNWADIRHIWRPNVNTVKRQSNN